MSARAATPIPLTMLDLQGHFSRLATRVRGMARRSRRISWLAWTFLLGGVFGAEALLVVIGFLFPLVTVSTTSVSSSTSYTVPLWGVGVALVPALLLLGLLLREFGRARREANAPALGPGGDPDVAAEAPTPGWSELVQECQRLVTHAKNETEFSFVPLVIGTFVLGELLASYSLSIWAASLGTLAVLVGPLVALPFLGLLWPLYRAMRRWLDAFQGELDRQVKEVAALESDFLWRFAGSGTNP